MKDETRLQIAIYQFLLSEEQRLREIRDEAFRALPRGRPETYKGFVYLIATLSLSEFEDVSRKLLDILRRF